MSGSVSSVAREPFRPLLGGAAAVLVVALGIAGLGRYRDLTVQRARETMLVERIVETDRRIADLKRQILLLRADPGTLERRAREDLGMARPGDLVVRVDSAGDREPVQP